MGLPSPAARGYRDVPLLLLALVAAASSIAALLLHVAGVVRMPFTVSYVTLPGLVLLTAITVWAGRTSRDLLFNRLWVGAAGGAIGLVLYDLIRLLVAAALPFKFDAFYSNRVFGTLMTGMPINSAEAIVAGWSYHITNGITFGVIYALLAGPARWWWGLIWGLVLEIAMLLVYPALYTPSSARAFLLVSIVGHAVFGASIGIWCERHAIAARRNHG